MAGNSTESWRLAPSIAQPIGMPFRSASTDHFQASLASVRRVLSGLLTTGRCPVLAAVEGCVGGVEAPDAVAGGECFGCNGFMDSGLDPLVAPGAHRRVGNLVRTESFGVLETAPGDEANEHHLEAVTIGLASPVSAEGVSVDRGGEQCRDCLPDDVFHFGSSARMMVRTSAGRRWECIRRSNRAATATGGRSPRALSEVMARSK